MRQRVNELGELLSKVKTSGAVSLNQPSQKADTAQQCDLILRPVMDLIDYQMRTISDVSAKLTAQDIRDCSSFYCIHSV